MQGVRNLLLISVLVLLIPSVWSQAGVPSASKPANDGKNCSTLNPYLTTFPSSILREKPVLLGSSALQTSKCKFVWGKGTCCNEPLLAQFAKAKNLAIDEALSKLKGYLEKINDKVDDIKKGSDSKKNFIEEYVKFLLQISMKDYKDEFEQISVKCWTYMKEVRGASLCSACAANSPPLFKDSKVKIDDPSCTAMLDQCWPFFDRLLAVVVPIGEMYEKINEWKLGANNTKVSDLTVSLMLISDEIKKNPKIKDMRIYNNPSSPADAKKNARANLCDALYVMNGPTFLEKIIRIFELVEMHTESIIDGYQAFKYEQVKRGIKILRRRLQEEKIAEFTAILKEEVKSQQTGAYQGDAVVAQGQTPYMNVTNAFP